MSRETWREGNRLALLENGEQFFPRAFEVMAAAQREIFVETFILFDDKVGQQLQRVLIDAARRGVHVELTVDGYGSPDIEGALFKDMAAAGVLVHVFDPHPRLFGFRTNIFRRMHRKIVVVDGRLAFIGGLNFSVDHLREYGPEGKQDYAMEIEGPLVSDIHRLVIAAVAPSRPWWRRRRAQPRPLPEQPRVGPATALLAWRDNDQRRDEIERHYREAIRGAKREILIANAYFFPGYRLLRELRNAARRGVAVRLVLQGNADMPIVRWIAQTLYDDLLRAGVEIYEYCERPFHGKVAVVDDLWATVGSSNLDPLSLSLNLEANVIVRDRAFARHLRGRLMEMMARHCRKMGRDQAARRTLWRRLLSFVAFHVARRFPAWAGLLPGNVRPVLRAVPPANETLPPSDKRAA